MLRSRLALKIALAVAAPIAFLALAEGALAVAGVGVPRYAGLRGSAKYWIPVSSEGKPAGFKRGFPRNYKYFPEEGPLFLRDKPANGWRLFVLGESTVQGLPYEVGSFSDWLRVRLAAMLSGRTVEVVNAGNPGWHATEIRTLLDECLEHQPDAFVWMVGHNEFVPQNVMRLRAEKNSPFLESARRAIHGLRLTHVLGRVVPPLSNRRIVLHDRHAVDELPCFTNEIDLLKQRFREAVAGAADDAKRASVPIVLCTLARNVRESSPSGSYFSENVASNPQLRARWTNTYNAGLAQLEAKKPADALATLRAAQAVDDQPAKLHFAMARALEMDGKPKEARAEFVAALERDSCPMRAQTWVADAIRDVARAQAVPLADVERLFDDAGRLGLAGDELVCDNVHPSLAGHEKIAELLLETLERELRLPLVRARDPARDDARDAIGVTKYTQQIAAREECRANARLVLSSGAADELWKRTLAACQSVVRENSRDWEVLGDLGMLEAIGGDAALAKEHIEAAWRGDAGLRINFLVGYKTSRNYQRPLDRAGIDMAAAEKALNRDEQRVLRNRLGKALGR